MPAARSKKEDTLNNRSDSPHSSDDAPDSSKPKRKRQSQSCDACRARKVRCARDDPDEAHQSCKHCVALGIKCTYDYQPKKRGPPNLYLRRLQEAAAAAVQSTPAHPPTSPVPSPIISTPLAPLALPPTPVSASVPFIDPSIPPSRYPIAADTQGFLQQQQQQLQTQGQHPIYTFEHHHPSPTNDGMYSSNGGGAPWTSPQSFASPKSATPHVPYSAAMSSPQPLHYPPYPPSYHQQAPQHSHHPHHPSPHSMHPPPPAHHAYPTPLSANVLPHPLTILAPPATINLLLTLFFSYIYPLTPCIHKPSFLADLNSGRHERDPLFFALVCSTVASTLVQVPRSYLPVGLDLGPDGLISDGVGGRRGVRRMAKRAYEASRHITVANYDPPSSMHVVIRYFDTVYHFCEGHDATSHASFGEAAHIAVTLHMHEEASYEGLDPIEREVRKRAFWLLFGADKSMALLLGRPICLRDEDCTLHFPTEVDDEYITLNGILPQPPGKTAVVSGLNYISRIFALLGEILVRVRVDKRSPPALNGGGGGGGREDTSLPREGAFWIKTRLDEVKALHARVCGALVHAPKPLQLNRKVNFAGHAGASTSSSSASSSGASLFDANALNGDAHADSEDRLAMEEEYEYGGAGFKRARMGEVKDFFDNPNASRKNASNCFLVMQANLYVTQQLVRFVIEQYRDELVGQLGGQDEKWVVGGDVTREGEDREAVASDLLNVLHSIPIQSIATNGPSLVHKVRFVASTLLDAVRKVDSAPASAARAHAYLWDFLSVLSEIERNYVLDDDRDEARAGEGVVS